MSHFELLSRAQIHDLVGPVVGAKLAPEGFDEVDTLKWVRSVDAPIRQVFLFSQWKGGAIAPIWGVSLDFVPHISGAKVKWHRTAKSAMPDLVVDARDRALDMPYHAGPEPIRERAFEVVSNAVIRAREFWDRSRRIADLPAAFDWLRSYLSTGGLGFYNYVQHPIAHAFVLSATGRLADANSELERFIGRAELTAELAAKLRALLEVAHVA